MYLDDAGRGLDDMRLIVAELFPLDRDVSENKMNRWLNVIAMTKTAEDDIPPLCRYEVQGRRYLHATGWQHQKINRPQPSRIPPCPVHESSVNDSRNDSVNDSLRESRNDSLPDSPPSRAPADQGSGIRDQGSGIKGSLAPASGAKAERPRDELWDAVVEACGWGADQITDAARGSLNGALKQLRAVEATPGQVKLRARRYRERFRDAALTPPALAKHWAALANGTASSSNGAVVRDPAWEAGMR
jgi:hypothetical protein